MERIITGWDRTWRKYYEVFASLSAVKKMILSACFALLTAVSAQLYVPLPFTPVPVTGQVFTVLLAGILLGRNAGALSQMLYLAGGIAGINWFYGGAAGFLRPTTGYIIGFIPAAYAIGLITEKKRSLSATISAMLFGTVLILSLGTLWLASFMRISLNRAFMLGFLPFIGFDIVKAYFAGLAGGLVSRNRGVK